MKVAFFEVTEESHQEYLKEKFPSHELTFLAEPLTVDTMDKAAGFEVVSVFVKSAVTQEVVNTLECKLIATRTTGFNHIDLEATKQKGITVSNVPFYGENTVAEHAMALLLALSRRIPQSIERVKAGEFNYEGLRGFDLKGKTLGLIGGGHIGMHVARMAKGFEMSVLVFDLYPDPAKASELGFEYVDMDALLSRSDVLSLHLPLNPQTEHTLSTNQFNMMKTGVVIINTARGGLIDTNALVTAFSAGKIGSLGLDVLEGEEFLDDELNLLAEGKLKDKLLTLIEDHALIESENVLVTPHNAFNSVEAVLRILDVTVENINAFATGTPANVVE